MRASTRSSGRRLSTIFEADQILVIDEGQIRERGTHEQLLRAAGLYRTQFAPQAGSAA
jgi:ABC-type transport system involved in Fe-S cluster assembly fused permease/ATPase subunit